MRCIAIAATTLDGKIALDEASGSSWTSPEDKDFLHEMLDKSDVVVVGNNTYKAAKEPLSKRNCIVLTHSVKATERVNDKLLLWNPEGESHSSILSSFAEASKDRQKTGMMAVLGGAQTYSYFLKEGLLDELYLTIEPLVFGRGIPLFADVGEDSAHFRLLSSKQLNEKGTMLLHYKVVR
ncbi:MAG: dihydrofolate reductase family protein [Patescibacteria group bacterium]|nr:dihydrofolate reductase family protein [Patescibacteria group bacterium]